MNDAKSVWLREIDAGTDNACWAVCAKGDPGATEFAPREEADQLRGTLRYIAAQAKAKHPGALAVIQANADMALGGGLSDNLRLALTSAYPGAATE